MIELGLPNSVSSKPVENWSGSVFAFVDDSPEVSRQENAEKVIGALRKELGAIPFRENDPIFNGLLKKRDEGTLSTEERDLLYRYFQ